MTIKVRMHPDPKRLESLNNGVGQVVKHYGKYLPQFDIEIVSNDSYDLLAAHAGTTRGECDIAHLHGLYWGDNIEAWQVMSNAYIVEACRSAVSITVPSEWVAETFRRDMRIQPYVIPHGIDAELWDYSAPHPKGGYVLWNKNRNTDVCNPEAVSYLADYFDHIQFKTTYANTERGNIMVYGSMPHTVMKPLVENCTVYLSTVKETFGIGVLEAMAAARPVLGWNYGGNRDLVQHCVNGYLAQPGNYDDLANGLDYCLTYAQQLGDNGRELVKQFTWPKAVEMLAECYREALSK